MNTTPTPTKITEKDIEKLAILARIKVTDQEKTQLVKEIDSILAYVDTIKKVTVAGGTRGVGASEDSAEGRIGAIKNVSRPDEARVISETDRERILVELPDREGDFAAVKKIL